MSDEKDIIDLEKVHISDSPAKGDAESATPSPTPSGESGSIGTNFKNFAKFGDPKSDGKQITLSNSDKWMKQAKIIDGKKITTTDTGIYFKKLKAQKVTLTQYKQFLEDLAKAKKVDIQEILTKLASCGAPGIHTAAVAVRKRSKEMTGKVTPNPKLTDSVNRLTDTSKYTGTHKQRFDETGKGKGIAGRKDLKDDSGYVTGYQHKDTFETNNKTIQNCPFMYLRLFNTLM